MIFKIVSMLFLLLAIPIFTAVAQDGAKVEKILEEIDPWVLTDTTRIMSFIDSCNTITTEKIQSSEFWEPTLNDLSFLLGIDYVAGTKIDNTGRIYFQMRITGESDAIFFMDKPLGWPVQLTPNNWTEKGFTISGFSVHPSGDYILVSVYKHGDEMNDIWYFTRDGQFHSLLVDRAVSYGGEIYDEDNLDIFYLYTYDRKVIHICKYTISESRLDTLYTEPGVFFPTDYYKGQMTAIRRFSRSESQLLLYNIADNKMTELSDTSIFAGAGFTNDEKIITYTSAESIDNEFMKVCLVDPVKPNKFKVIYDPKMEIDDFAFERKTGNIIVVLNKDGYSKLAGFDVDGNLIAIPQPEIGNVSGIFSNESNEVVFNFSAPTISPAAYKFKIGDDKLEKLAGVSTFGFDFSDVKVDLIRYKSEDGTEIPAFIYIPSSAKKDGSNPAIVNYHGGPSGQSRPYFQRNMAFALSKGFVYILPNVRGSTGYGTAYEEADNLEKRYDALKDAEGAIDYLINEGWSSPDKIAIWGGSYGGYTVNWLGTQCSEKFACIVSEVGIGEWDHTILNSNPIFVKSWEKEVGKVGGDLNRKLAPLFYADNISCPIFLTGGFNDPRVPPSDPRRFAYVLSRLGKQVWYFEETKTGHGASVKAQVIRDLATNYVFTMMHVMR
ncbi:MAG: S9 family peptidase [candidate division Zixibacteria bacterium]|nr:S9 family peptidase [candidate division Zixibacteria bacterium]